MKPLARAAKPPLVARRVIYPSTHTTRVTVHIAFLMHNEVQQRGIIVLRNGVVVG